MTIDLTQYKDFTTELDAKVVADVEGRLRTVLKAMWPDLDTTPSSVFGSLVLTPAARCVALFEQTANCVLSDINLTNALNGIVCDCDFVTEYLEGMGIASLSDVNCTGMARFYYNAEKPADADYYTFDTGQILLFNNTYVFSIYTASNMPIKIYPPSYEGALDTVNNEYKLSICGIDSTNAPNEFFVDIPIYGPAAAAVSEGDEAAIDQDFPNFDQIRSVESVTDIEPFEAPTSLAELIEFTRNIQPTANLTTKGNVTSYVFHKFPQTVAVSPVIGGDSPEMIRDLQNTALVNQPYMDIYVKSTVEPLEVGEYVLCDVTPRIIQGTVYKGKISNQHVITRITGIGVPGSDDRIQFVNSNTGARYAIKPSQVVASNFQYWGSPASNPERYTLEEQFRLIFHDSSIAEDSPVKPEVFDVVEEQNGQNVVVGQQAWVVVYYNFDPMVEALNKTVKGPSCCPAVSTVVKPFVTAEVDNLTITYRKTPGKFFDRQTAIENIYDFVNSLAFPDKYDDAYIGDIIIANGGAGIIDITASVDVCASVAKGMFDTNYAPMHRTLDTLSLDTDSSDIQQFYKTYGIGYKNINYILDRENIVLNEQPSI